MRTKTEKILIFIRDNQPARVKDICEAVLEKRQMRQEYWDSKLHKYVNIKQTYNYYVGWSGFRESLAFSTYNKSKPRIKRLKSGRYVLTKLGRQYLESKLALSGASLISLQSL